MLSKDGNLVSFTPGLHASLQLKVLFAGIILLLVGLFCILRARLVRQTIAQALAAVERFARFLCADAVRLWQDFIAIKLAAWEWAAIAGLTVCAALLRLPFMSHLLEYDEAFTFIEYARYPLSLLVSDYSLPNNHIFHTILVHFSYLLFGNTLFAIRLPVLIGGLCLVPCVYLLTRRFYNKTAALLAAALATTYPLLILKSTSARGYILIALLVVVALALGEYLAVRKNLAGWLAWSLCIALGFYTNPSMFYPFAVLFVWMALRMIRAGRASAYTSWRECALYLGSFSVLAAVFTISFYLPVFFKNGILNFFNGSRVADSLPLGAFLAGLPDVLSELGDEWRFQLPDGLSLLLVAGVLFSCAFFTARPAGRRDSIDRIPGCPGGFAARPAADLDRAHVAVGGAADDHLGGRRADPAAYLAE